MKKKALAASFVLAAGMASSASANPFILLWDTFFNATATQTDAQEREATFAAIGREAVQREAAEKADREAGAMAQREATEKAQREATEKAQREAEVSRREADKAQRQAAEKAQRETDRLQREVADRARETSDRMARESRAREARQMSEPNWRAQSAADAQERMARAMGIRK